VANQPASPSKAEAHASSHGPGRYIAIWLILLAFTGLTVWTGRMDLGAANIGIALAIATVKATLVVLFFMHVKYSSRLTKMVVGMALFFLLVLFTLTLTDYMSRGWFASPRGSTGAGTQVTITPAGPLRTVAPAASAEH
jgi:cytochrome c oxidase subunit 4